MKFVWRWVLVSVALLLPHLLVMVAGWRWLYEQGWLLWWAGLAVALTMLGRMLQIFFSRRTKKLLSSVQASPRWPPAGDEAWKEVERLSQRYRADEEKTWDNIEDWSGVAQEVLEAVARHYRPGSKHPLYEVPVPHVLKIGELVARDLRVAMTKNVPGSHILTINDLRKLQQMASFASKVYGPTTRLYRAMRLGLNPAVSLFREMSEHVASGLVSRSSEEMRKWGIDFFVKKCGFYAIELYSGNLVLEETELADYFSQRSEQDVQTQKARQQQFGQEPLRVLVLGQVKAGKSSVINALLGQTLAAVDVVSRTATVEAHALERDGLQQALILDTAGYDEAESADRIFAELKEEILLCDVVLLAVSADHAARQADRRLLDDLRDYFQRNPQRRMPPVLVPLTHIDRLRPLKEWEPPYDLVHGTDTKSRNIAAAAESVAEALAINREQIVPVCTLPGRLYNIDETLLPAILQVLPDAERVKYLRCLRQQRDERYWQQIWQQARGAGRLLLGTGRSVLSQMATRRDDASTPDETKPQ